MSAVSYPSETLSGNSLILFTSSTYLNIDFSDTQDPLKKARDVREVGHYSHGYTEVTIKEPGEIPYILTFIKQAYEKS
ncbi:MAG: hypothetical protein WCF23_15475 [Candidatus Nitrosopolaris sp.]